MIIARKPTKNINNVTLLYIIIFNFNFYTPSTQVVSCDSFYDLNIIHHDMKFIDESNRNGETDIDSLSRVHFRKNELKLTSDMCNCCITVTRKGIMIIIMMILSVVLNSLCSSYRPQLHDNHFRISATFPFYSNSNQNDYTNTVNNYKLPIIQIIVKQELVGELFYDNENNKELFILKLKAIIKQQQINKNKVDDDDDKDNNNKNCNISEDKTNDAGLYNNRMQSIINNDRSKSYKSSIRHNTIDNIYTDDMLVKSLNNNGDKNDNNKIILLKIYNDNCRRCLDIESIYINIISSLNRDEFYCIQARSNDIPSYMQGISHRLLGLKKTITTLSSSSMMIKTISSNTAKIDDNDDDDQDNIRSSNEAILYDLICNTCNNSGRIDCIDCNGKGYMMKGSIASYCSTCCGKKVIRCHTCGGKCLNC
jgi:hypothetical protein